MTKPAVSSIEKTVKKTRLPVDDVIDALDERENDKSKTVGGYPAVICVVENTLVAASVDHDGEPMLETISIHEALNKFRKAKSLVNKGVCKDLNEALYEVNLLSGD